MKNLTFLVFLGIMILPFTSCDNALHEEIHVVSTDNMMDGEGERANATRAPHENARANVTRAPHVVSIDNMMDGEGRYVYDGLAWGSTVEETEEKLGIILGEPASTGRLNFELYLQLDCVEIIINNIHYKGRTLIGFNDGALTQISFEFRMSANESAYVIQALINDLESKYGEPHQITTTEDPRILEVYGWLYREDSVVTSLGVSKSRGSTTDVVSISMSIIYLD